MITVIIAGGSGTRLWPLSTQSYPKHLLALTGELSLLQSTFERARRLGDVTYVITEQSHADYVKQQLPELPSDAFIIEPGRRNTASCVIAALHHVRLRNDLDEPIVFLSADHSIRDLDGFELSFRRAAELSQKLHCEVLVGVEPTYPSTGFGYIEKGTPDEHTSAFTVKSFKEKPDLVTAKKFVATGRYLWNTGYFVGSVNVFLDTMAAFAPDLKTEYDALCATTNQHEYEQVYLGFKNEQIDVALNEKVDGLMVVPASFDWMDVGSFKDLHEANELDETGNVIIGKQVYPIDVENSYIRNEDDKPLALIGVDNIVVVNTKDGILVARKDLAHKVGEIAKTIQS
ncbi:MAG: sugar phosphate nucleotidyltransferase [Candidatus Saccharimonadales bacterium]